MFVRLGAVLCLPVLLLAQSSAGPGASDMAAEIAAMHAEIERLQHRVDELEAKQSGAAPAVRVTQTPAPASADTAQTAKSTAAATAAALPAADQNAPPVLSNFMRGTSLNFLLDGYYGYNFNDPIGRVNRLRAYDVLSNAFSLNQADVVVENAPDPANGKPWGLRLDLQFGQATETLQGNATNEPRPDIYRNIFQAYGTYVVPVGSGLTINFGKFASSLGYENNFTQDQINYSRSYWFDFLPFYHMGVRMNYQLTKDLGVNYWIVNGTQQTEPFNAFKDQFIGLAFQPNSKFSWNVNYYLGQEHPDTQYLPNSTDPTLPMEQGEDFLPIANAPKGKLHILDTYMNWQPHPKLTLALEADYVIERLYTNSFPEVTWGGAGYARYQLSPRFAIGGRAELLEDQNGGLFSGASQSLKETTVTLEQKILEGMLLREEWRRDFSNQGYFYTDLLGILKREQNTATVGVVWWFGPKKSPW